MCGIVGLIDTVEGRIAPQLLESMRDVMVARGPDDGICPAGVRAISGAAGINSRPGMKNQQNLRKHDLSNSTRFQFFRVWLCGFMEGV